MTPDTEATLSLPFALYNNYSNIIIRQQGVNGPVFFTIHFQRSHKVIHPQVFQQLEGHLYLNGEGHEER